MIIASLVDPLECRGDRQNHVMERKAKYKLRCKSCLKLHFCTCSVIKWTNLHGTRLQRASLCFFQVVHAWSMFLQNQNRAADLFPQHRTLASWRLFKVAANQMSPISQRGEPLFATFFQMRHSVPLHRKESSVLHWRYDVHMHAHGGLAKAFILISTFVWIQSRIRFSDLRCTPARGR